MGNIKHADDQNFEQSFFQLAYNRLQDKLKNLLPYLVGFEIVKKEKEGTKALGVFGFRSPNGQVIYVPAIFINGTVKGLNSLYSKNNGQYYPLTEDFAELFLREGGGGLGEASKQTPQDIRSDALPVDLRDLVVPPRTGKYAIASVLDVLTDASDMEKKAFMTWMEQDEDFCGAALRFYTIEKIASALVPTGLESKDSLSSTRKVKLVTKADKAEAKKLPDSAKQTLFDQGWVIVDERSEDAKSKFGPVKLPDVFSNPQESGFYPYVTKHGRIQFGLVLMRLKHLFIDQSVKDCLIVSLDPSSKGNTYIADPKDVFVKNQIHCQDYSQVLKLLISPAELEPSFSDTYVLVNEQLRATIPFKVVANFKDPHGIRRLQIEFVSSDSFDRVGCCRYVSQEHRHIGSLDESYTGGGNSGDRKTKVTGTMLVFTKKPGDSLHYTADTVYVPAGFKALPLNIHGRQCCALNDAFDSKETDESRKARRAREEKASQEFRANAPGSLSVVNGLLQSKSVLPMVVQRNGSEFFSTVGDVKKHYDSADKMKIGMVLDYGLDLSDAETIHETLQKTATLKGMIKLADLADGTPPPYADETPYANELGQPTTAGIPYIGTAPHTNSYNEGSKTSTPGQMTDVQGIRAAIQQASRLAATGQKEIFDVQALSTLAKYVSPSEKVDAYAPVFISALDKLGRLLFMLDWEVEKFSELYGKEDMPDLVELLNNVFQNLGDLVIFLKRKSPALSINMAKEDSLNA